MKIKIIFFLVLLIVGYLIYYRLSNLESTSSETPNLEETSQEFQPDDQESEPIITSSQEIILSEEETIRLFFRLVNDQQIDPAISLMVIDEGEKWRSYLESFETVSVLDVKKTDLGSFQVNLDVTMKPESANEPIPNFGYVNGENIKFVNLTQEEGVWKLQGIATGP